MPSTILSDNGVSSGSAGIKTTADSTGALALQTTTAGGAATTAVTIDTSQNVGIGTASPSATGLQITKTAGVQAGVVITNPANTWTMWCGASTNYLAFVDNTAGERLRIDSSGNVGIGTGSPTQKLDVRGQGYFQSTSADAVVEVNSSGGSGRSYQIRSQSGGQFYVYDNTAGSARMVIDSSGNVGIGTSSPRTSKLDVMSATGTQNTSGDNSGLVNITGPNGANGSQPIFVIATNDAMAANIGPAITFQARYLTSSTAAATIGYIQCIKENATSNNLQGALTFTTRNSAGNFPEAMRIDSSGSLIIGGTTAVGQLNVIAPANTKTEIYMNKVSQVEGHIGFKTSTDSNWYFGTGATLGTYGLYQANTGTAWIAVSDERFKTELQSIENALEKVSGIRAVTGRYSYDEENGVTKRRAFLIAQDFINPLPEAVDQQDPDKFGLSYSDTIPLLYAAIKELKALTDAQASTITALTARIETLENKT